MGKFLPYETAARVSILYYFGYFVSYFGLLFWDFGICSLFRNIIYISMHLNSLAECSITDVRAKYIFFNYATLKTYKNHNRLFRL